LQLVHFPCDSEDFNDRVIPRPPSGLKEDTRQDRPGLTLPALKAVKHQEANQPWWLGAMPKLIFP